MTKEVTEKVTVEVTEKVTKRYIIFMRESGLRDGEISKLLNISQEDIDALFSMN